MWKDFAGFCCIIIRYVDLFQAFRSPGVTCRVHSVFLSVYLSKPGVRTFAPIVSAHPYCARKFTPRYA